jgi:hypothetical protein
MCIFHSKILEKSQSSFEHTYSQIFYSKIIPIYNIQLCEIEVEYIKLKNKLSEDLSNFEYCG